MKNVSSDFFPPRVYSHNYLLEGERAETKLVSDVEYMGLYRQNKLEGRKVLKSLVEGAVSVPATHKD